MAISIEAAATFLGVGRTVAYQEARKGTLDGIRVIRVGRRMTVPVYAIEERIGPLSDDVLEEAVIRARRNNS